MKHSPGGYTLVEMLTVVGVVAILSTIVFVSLTSARNDQELSSAVNVLSLEVRQVIAWAQTGKLEESSGALPEGYGMVIQPSGDQYFLYAEFDGDNQFQSTGSDVIIATRSLAEDEQIDRVILESCTPAGPDCDLYSRRYSGSLYTNGTQVDNLVINLQHEVTLDTSIITVQRATGTIDTLY